MGVKKKKKNKKKNKEKNENKKNKNKKKKPLHQHPIWRMMGIYPYAEGVNNRKFNDLP